MKVYLGPKAASSAAGMFRVYDALFTHLPQFGIDIVDTIEEADVIHAHIGVYFNVPYDKPLVMSSHGMLWEEDEWGPGAYSINRTCFDAYHQADVVTAPSQFVAHAIERHTLIRPQVVRHSIDANQWQPLGSHGNYILWNKARQDPASDPAHVMELAKHLPEYQFISTFGREAPNVKITGPRPPDDMKQIIQHAVVYFDSPTESGGPCYGVLEAMASGIPVLAWRTGGNAESVEHGVTGYLAEPGNYEDLASGARYCVERRDVLGRNARVTVQKKYTPENNVRGYIRAYETAIARQQFECEVSVVIPAYNLGTFLGDCLESVLAQTHADFEVIVVDDASADSTPVVVDQYAQDARVRYIRNDTNRHVAYSRNRGILAARGRFILPLDADDRLPPHALHTLSSVLKTQREVAIVSGALEIFHPSDFSKSQRTGWPNGVQPELQIEGHNRLPYSSMYRKKVWQNVGGYRERIKIGVEDADFWMRALSYGYAADLVKATTLWYTHRDDSLGKQNQEGDVAWLKWFGWHYDKSIVPAAIRDNVYHSASHFDQPLVSIIVPVGPGHEHYLRDCVDSIIAQSIQSWELIIINDTGELWDERITRGMPVILINKRENVGVAAARNLGLQRVKAPYVVFLDGDDIAHPHMLENMLMYAGPGCWCYGDWDVYNGQEITHNTAPEWDKALFLSRMIAPFVGIYPTHALRAVEGFTEAAPGWEDWDLQLKLVREGFCGQRIPVSLFTYNMHLGTRREDNFARKESLLQYIYDTYRKEDMTVACKSCGKTNVKGMGTRTVVDQSNDMIQFVYTGPTRMRFKSKTVRGATYVAQPNEVVLVHPGDAAWVDLIPTLVRAQDHSLDARAAVADAPIMPPPEPKVIVEDIVALGLDEKTTKILKEHFNGVFDLSLAQDEEILGIKGVGQKRLDGIREKIQAWASGTL